MARKKKNSSAGEFEQHIVAVRMRVTGEGNLQLTLTDLDDTRSFNMVDLPLQPTNRFEPMRLSNFQSQRIRLVGEVTELNEWFNISKIIIFSKPVAAEYPQ